MAESFFYRAFVYNHHLDWHNLKNDRAKAAYDNFHPLDGAFDDNVIIQIKNGPIDFQVREPASPLFAGLRHTNEAVELQITQEYTGQQRHTLFSRSHVEGSARFRYASRRSASASESSGRGPRVPSSHRRLRRRSQRRHGCKLDSAVRSPWRISTASDAWPGIPNLSAEKIIDEWTRLTFGNDPLVEKTIDQMQLSSWHVYESYTGPLGVGTLTNITGNHYDPGPESSEENGWGQWHRADHQGIGMDRTIATGTGYIGQYPPPLQKLYESLATCPDNLLLFFHHVPYTYVLHSGKTVIQHIYDSHYEGADRARDFIAQWKTLDGHVDDERYRDILARLQYQAQQAIVWRDAICNWIYMLSGIPDDQGRVGKSSSHSSAKASLNADQSPR